MRAEAKLFSADLIDDMHRTFDEVCRKLGLAPKPDKATELVVTKIVELAKVGHRGEALVAETLRFFEAYEDQQSSSLRSVHSPGISAGL
jgi:hypothetical protein